MKYNSSTTFHSKVMANVKVFPSIKINFDWLNNKMLKMTCCCRQSRPRSCSRTLGIYTVGCFIHILAKTTMERQFFRCFFFKWNSPFHYFSAFPSGLYIYVFNHELFKNQWFLPSSNPSWYARFCKPLTFSISWDVVKLPNSVDTIISCVCVTLMPL